jgi:hypothetical protein
MRAALITLLVLGATGAATTTVARAADSSPTPPKASSLAPHSHGGARSYGAPIQPRILNHVYRRPRKTTHTTARP